MLVLFLSCQYWLMEDDIQQRLDIFNPVELIPSGSFEMGCTEGDDDCSSDEYPVHTVEITREFYLMESEVTQGLYESVMGENPSSFSDCGTNCPVEDVSWFDAVEFANILSEIYGLEPCYSIDGEDVSWENGFDCNGWRLPTEAEWEYAARGGEDYIYSGSNDVDDVAWYSGNSGSQTHEVCGLQKNGYGLCDMSGNVYEWCWDWYDGSLYGTHADQGTVQDPYGANNGSTRVIRGGSWSYGAGDRRVSNRGNGLPFYEYGALGFRLGRTP